MTDLRLYLDAQTVVFATVSFQASFDSATDFLNFDVKTLGVVPATTAVPDCVPVIDRVVSVIRRVVSNHGSWFAICSLQRICQA